MNAVMSFYLVFLLRFQDSGDVKNDRKEQVSV